MSGTVTTLILFAEGGGLYDRIFNVAGFELWKFLNLAIFVGLMIYVAKKPLSEAFKAKREQIRADLIKAEQEKQAALARLTSAEASLAQLDTEKEKVLQRAKEEAAAEAQRIAAQTDDEIVRLRQQTDSELDRLAKLSRGKLKRLSAEESIRLAAEKLRGQMTGDNDAKLVRASIQEIGGLS